MTATGAREPERPERSQPWACRLRANDSVFGNLLPVEPEAAELTVVQQTLHAPRFTSSAVCSIAASGALFVFLASVPMEDREPQSGDLVKGRGEVSWAWQLQASLRGDPA